MTMERVETRQTQQIRCAACSQIVPSYDIVNFGSVEKGYRALCSQCFNTEMAQLDGLDGFEHVTFEPVRLTDCTGETHEFHFRTHLFAPESPWTLSSFATVIRPATNFRSSATREDLLVLLGRLKKMRRTIIKHVQITSSGCRSPIIEWCEARSGGTSPKMAPCRSSTSMVESGRSSAAC